jgi:L-malate glycosyltransferase
MRVLHVISGDLWAGAEAQACTLLTSLQALEGVQVAAALMNDGELADRLRASAIPVSILPEHELSVPAIARRLRSVMLDWRPSVVHTHRLKENILGSLVNATSIRVPSLRTVHGAREHPASGVLRLHKRAVLSLERFCGRHFQKKIVAVSRELATLLAAEYPPESIVVIENGVDVEALRAQVHAVAFRERLPGHTHVGFVGRLVRVKRPDLFLEMAALLRTEVPDRRWRFHLFGDGPLRQRLAEQAIVLGVDDITEFHGHRGDSIACMAALDLLVMCSDHEGLPMALLESLVVGTPVVAHAVGGIPEVIDGCSGGRTVHAHTAAGYAAATLESLRSDPSRVGPQLQARIAQRYSARNNALRVYELYRTLAREAA